MSLIAIANTHNKEDFYNSNGFYRQLIYKKKKSLVLKRSINNSIVTMILNERKKNKRLGARRMYYKFNIKTIGVNKFEKIMSENNLSVKNRKKRIITTQGVHEQDDRNLINGLILYDINQVIAGDITYLITKNKTYYIFTLKDMYSKRILGLDGSEDMTTESVLKALNQAYKLRGKSINYCIHHTDAGSQYKSTLYKKYMKKHMLKPSYADNCLENGMAEQLNGMVKNDYLPSEIKNVNELKKLLKNIKKKLNEEIPIKELGYKTPIQFECEIEKIPLNQRKKIKLYDFKKKGDF